MDKKIIDIHKLVELASYVSEARDALLWCSLSLRAAISISRTLVSVKCRLAWEMWNLWRSSVKIRYFRIYRRERERKGNSVIKYNTGNWLLYKSCYCRCACGCCVLPYSHWYTIFCDFSESHKKLYQMVCSVQNFHKYRLDSRPPSVQWSRAATPD